MAYGGNLTPICLIISDFLTKKLFYPFPFFQMLSQIMFLILLLSHLRQQQKDFSPQLETIWTDDRGKNSTLKSVKFPLVHRSLEIDDFAPKSAWIGYKGYFP